MSFLERYNLSGLKILKGLTVLVLGIFVLYFTFSLLSNMSYSSSATRSSGGYYGGVPDGFQSTSLGGNFMESVAVPSFSRKNIASYRKDYNPGMDAENFELTEYRATIETRKLSEACQSIVFLKSKNYVIFETSNNSNNNCNFHFKVKKDNTDEILELIKSLKPKDLNENIESIKKQINNFTSEEDILKRKLQTMEDTLSNAIASYDEISRLATRTRDAQSLANIIDSKIKTIERLTIEKINTSTQLERISKLKAEQVDKLEYTYFNVNIYENKYFDTVQLKNTWKYSIKRFVNDMNGVLQDMTIGLVALIAFTFKYLTYLLIVVLVAKFVWGLLKKIWNR